jgi:hypothetical protein
MTTQTRFHDMPTIRVAAVQKMLSTPEGQDLIRMFEAQAIKEWDEVMGELRQIADAPAADGWNPEQATRNARTNEWAAGVLRRIMAKDEELTYLTTDL